MVMGMYTVLEGWYVVNNFTYHKVKGFSLVLVPPLRYYPGKRKNDNMIHTR